MVFNYLAPQLTLLEHLLEAKLTADLHRFQILWFVLLNLDFVILHALLELLAVSFDV